MGGKYEEKFLVPAGLPSAKALAETDNVLEVQDSSFNQENNNFSPEKTVSEKAASSTMSVSSVFSISGPAGGKSSSIRRFDCKSVCAAQKLTI